MDSKILQHNMNRFKKRERTQNWAYEEKRFLLELCRKDMKIIENKRLDSSLTALKNRAWRIIHQQFTATFGTDRDCNRLKEQWRRMKACTRAEMMDYQHRITRYGQEMADRKRPNPFSFEIWEFMQEAKRACKSEAMDDIDYSKMKLSLEENLPEGIIVDDTKHEILDEGDEDESTMWSYLREKSTQNICEVEIKEETVSEDNYNYNNKRNSNYEELSDQLPLNKKRLSFLNNKKNENSIPSLSINNVAATLDTLNLLKTQMHRNSNNNINNSSRREKEELITNNHTNDDCIKQFVEMQTREHLLRMQILQVELEMAKFNRDTAEINRQIALKKFNENINNDSS